MICLYCGAEFPIEYDDDDEVDEFICDCCYDFITGHDDEIDDDD